MSSPTLCIKNKNRVERLQTYFKVSTLKTSEKISSDNEDTSQQKTIGLPTFLGGKKKYAIWWKKFTAYTTLKKFAGALDKNFDLQNDPENITSTDEEKKKYKANVVRNNLAVACPTMAFLSEEDMEYLEDSATTNYPNGIAKNVVVSLSDHYRPADRLSAVEAETEMRGVKLGAKENPESYFKRVAVVKSKYRKEQNF